MFIILLAVAAHYASVLYIHRNLIYDDAYITYRYALNVAHGYGITWNRLESPTEGYTSFLHVVLLAPFIRFELDPLVAAKAMSVLSGVGIAVLTGLFARKYYNASGPVAALVGMSYLPMGYTAVNSAAGMETVIYTFLLFASFYCFTLFCGSRMLKHFALFCVMQFVCFLSRPEALLLSLPMGIILIIDRDKAGPGLPSLLKTYGLLFIAPLAVYFAWKKMHFGYFLPNPFYLKAGTDAIISPLGSKSVIDFYQSEMGLIGVVLMSFVIPYKTAAARHRHRLFCIIITTVHSLFYLHADTLMDEYCRFLYPVTPFLYFLAIPPAVILFSSLLDKKWVFLIKMPFAIATILILFVVFSPIEPAFKIKLAMNGVDPYRNKNLLMNKRLIVAKRLSEYPGIKDISIALGDAGYIPYFTRVEVLDYVGLNDPYIARERDRKKLVDYFFSKKPTMVILNGDNDLRWLTYGHGPLGNLTTWIFDPRWDGYGYAGTVFGQMYNMHFYIRKDYPEFKNLSSFIKENVAEKVYKYPLITGTQYSLY